MEPEVTGDKARVVEGAGVAGEKLVGGVGGAAVLLAAVEAGEMAKVVDDCWGMFKGSKSNFMVPAGRIARAGVEEGVAEEVAGVGLVPKIVVGTGAAKVG